MQEKCIIVFCMNQAGHVLLSALDVRIKEFRKVCKLKSLHMLKQALRSQFKRFATVIQEFGLSYTQKDPISFASTRRIGFSSCICKYINYYLKQRFQTKDLGHYIISQALSSKIQAGNLPLLEEVCTCILLKGDMLGCKVMEGMMDSNFKLLSHHREDIEDPGNTNDFQKSLHLTVTSV